MHICTESFSTVTLVPDSESACTNSVVHFKLYEMLICILQKQQNEIPKKKNQEPIIQRAERKNPRHVRQQSIAS